MYVFVCVFLVGGAGKGSAGAQRGTEESRQDHCSAHTAVSRTTTTTSTGTDCESEKGNLCHI